MDLCTVPCSGAVYLAVLSMLALQQSFVQSYPYLVLYNVMFVVPPVATLAAASARPTMNRLAHWNFHHREWVRLGLGSGVAVLGLAILARVRGSLPRGRGASLVPGNSHPRLILL